MRGYIIEPYIDNEIYVYGITGEKFLNERKLIHDELIYLGEKYSDTWNSEDEIPLDLKGNLFYIHYSVSGTQCGAIGAWTTEDQNLLKTYPYSLGETILYSIESFLKEIG